MKILSFISNIESKTVLGLFIGLLAYLYKCIDISILILIILMIFDYISGISVILKDRIVLGKNKFDYKIGVFGAIKKLFYFMIIATGFLIDYLIIHYSSCVNFNINTNGGIGFVICFYFIGNEGLSLVQNWLKLGIKVPSVLTNIFEKFINQNVKK